MAVIHAVDLFCGAGGTSTGLIQAASSLGKKAELTAINHWDKAIETHAANHPEMRHLCESIDNVDPRKVFPQGRINLLVASPECTHHSNARGGKPRSDQSRASAWHIVRWAEALYIDNILVENVPEFASWGPLGADGKPMKSMKGKTFLAFQVALESLGYRVDWKIINTADYGDPTCRKRFFLIARRGNKRIRWPEPTHSEKGGKDLFGETEPWVPAKEIIDWDLPGQSIFNRKKPLAEKTLARIEHGLWKFGGEQFITIYKGQSKTRGVNEPLPTLTTQQNMYLCEPFFVGIDHASAGAKHVRSINKPSPTVITQQNYGLVEPFILPQQAGRKDQLRVRSVDQPLPTLTTTGAEALVEPFITSFHGGKDAERRVHDLASPIPTLDCSNRYGLVEPFLVQYNGKSKVHSLDRPLGTITTADRFGLVETFRKTPGIDIRFRMLQPHELAAAQSFPKGYKFAGNKTETVKQIGNAVPVRTARALCKELLR